MIARASDFERTETSRRAVTVERARELCPQLEAMPDGEVVLFLDRLYELARVAVEATAAAPRLEVRHGGG